MPSKRLADSILVMFVLVLLGTAMKEGRAGELQFLTEEMPPLNYHDGTRPAGIAVEIVKGLARAIGEEPSITILPWNRAYSIASTQANKALFSVIRTAKREASFHWIGPIFAVTDYLYAKGDSPPTLDSLGEARAVSGILLQAESGLEEQLRALDFTNLIPVNQGDPLLMLLQNRAELLANADVITRYHLRTKKLDPSLVKPVILLKRQDMYLGISALTDESVVERWRAAFDTFKGSKEFGAILTRYGVQARADGER